MTHELALLAVRVEEVFADIHHRVFLGDPAANPRLRVEVVDAAMVEDTPSLVLITPWTLNGLAFVPYGELPETLPVGERRLPVFTNEIAGLGTYQSVNLLSDVSGLSSPEAARVRAGELGDPFRAALFGARRRVLVANPARRSLLMPWSMAARDRAG